MVRNELELMATQRKLARVEEFESKASLARAEAELRDLENRILHSCYEQGLIDGRNAEARKRQEADVLLNDVGYQAQVEEVKLREATATMDQAEREYHDDMVSLTKAWLYSQRGDL